MIVFAIVSSGRELFMADSSVFVDDAEAYDVYERQEESEANEEPVNFHSCAIIFAPNKLFD